MSSALSPGGYDMANTSSTPMTSSPFNRRNSRSSGSQSGQRPSRVEKPRSNHNSPRAMERRKTTSGTRKYATLDDHYNMMFGITGDEEANEDQKEASRPMSWHPSSQFHVPSRSSMVVEQSPAQDWSRHYSASSRNSAHGSDFYSLSARSSMLSEQFPNHQTPAHDVHRGSQDSDASWQSHQTSANALSSLSTSSTEPMPWYLQEWARKNHQTSTSRNGSADFLPIQNPAAKVPEQAVEDEDMEDTEDTGKDLVGMGLYDLPDTALSWNSSSLLEGTGKGLKLEETWQPPEDEDDDDEEDHDADDVSSDDGSVEELPTAKETAQIPIHNAKPQIPGSMDGQSFFFDEDETYTKEWWFQQLKQPSMPVQDAGLGYGWL